MFIAFGGVAACQKVRNANFHADYANKINDKLAQSRQTSEFWTAHRSTAEKFSRQTNELANAMN